jgi:hypothetical protein
MALNLIYQFRPSQNLQGDFRTANYCVVFFFSEDGFIDRELLVEMAKVIPEADHDQLTFASLDDLKNFSLRVAQELQDREVRLISVQDYNIGVDGARDLAQYQQIFQSFGEVIMNEEARKKKGGLLGKLFS